MADTLLGVVQEALAKATDEQKRAKDDLVDAQADLAEAQQQLADATKELLKLQNKAIEIRRKIAETTSAADGKKLFDDLDVNTSKLRKQQAAIAEAQESIAFSRSRLGGAQDELTRAAAAAQASGNALAAAKRRDDDHTAWTSKAKSAGLSGLPAKADVSAAGPAKTAADAAAARIDGASGGDVPKELFARAHDRRKQRADRLEALDASARGAEDRAADEAAKTGFGGKTAKARLSIERSEAELRTFALTAQERFDRALALLAGVKNSTGLNDAEKARVKELFDAAKAVNVFTLESKRDAARKALEDQQASVDAAILDALAKTPSADPQDNAKVKTEVGKLGALETALTNADDDYQAQKDKLDALEAAIPDATWALVSDYEEALSLLADLADDDPTALADAVAADEDAYAKAVRTEQDSARTVLAVGELARAREDLAAAAAQARPARLLEALRGDD
jgi:hypothetical protein